MQTSIVDCPKYVNTKYIHLSDIVSAEFNQGRKLFKGGNYSKAETIDFLEVLTAETIQGRKVFKGGNYSRAETINY